MARVATAAAHAAWISPWRAPRPFATLTSRSGRSAGLCQAVRPRTMRSPGRVMMGWLNRCRLRSTRLTPCPRGARAAPPGATSCSPPVSSERRSQRSRGTCLCPRRGSRSRAPRSRSRRGRPSPAPSAPFVLPFTSSLLLPFVTSLLQPCAPRARAASTCRGTARFRWCQRGGWSPTVDRRWRSLQARRSRRTLAPAPTSQAPARSANTFRSTTSLLTCAGRPCGIQATFPELAVGATLGSC
mmetsp:Transcript_78297/g.201604  ORF Transcript_78297/g.201604 Transcript_78297/m.201604 type:complete len:242 (+) Transcript_78297:876-1601(+)